MAEALPERIRPVSLGRSGATLNGYLTLASLPRLAALASGTDGDVEVSIEFKLDEQQVPLVNGTLRTSIGLVCQRCLEPVSVCLDCTLAVAFPDHPETPIDERYEVAELDGDEVSLRELIEDELILSLPITPLHGDGEHCDATPDWQSDSNSNQQQQNPFSVLAELKILK